jgi:hypothetical protein
MCDRVAILLPRARPHQTAHFHSEIRAIAGEGRGQKVVRRLTNAVANAYKRTLCHGVLDSGAGQQ